MCARALFGARCLNIRLDLSPYIVTAEAERREVRIGLCVSMWAAAVCVVCGFYFIYIKFKI